MDAVILPQFQVRVKPFLRWAGSKRKLLSHLRRYWRPTYHRYVEPFAGSSCLFFELGPDRALLSDKNAELIETYLVVRDWPREVYDAVAALPRTKVVYNEQRSRDTRKLRPFDRAVRFIYLNRNCFNGIYRTNTAGRFNVPFSSSRTGQFVSRDEFLACGNLLRKAELRAWDFGTTLRYVSDGDFVYLDPPFAVANRRVFREYGADMFGFGDLARLAQHLTKIVDRGADFLVSYADCRESRAIAAQWNSRRVRVRRHVAGFTGARRLSYELLITNLPVRSF